MARLNKRRRFNPSSLEIGACRLSELPEVMMRAMTSETAPPRMMTINISARLRALYAALEKVEAERKAAKK